MNKEWTENAEARFKQVMSGNDITFTDVFLPYWKEYFSGQIEKGDAIEVGCGPGVLSKELLPMVNSLTCVEKDYAMYSIACRYNCEMDNIQIYNCAIEEYSGDRKYDICLAHMVLHNIGSLDKVLVRINELLKLNGKFIFSIPHPCFYHFYKKELSNTEYMTDYNMQLEFTITMDKKPLPQTITYYHRSLKSYIEVIREHGFVINNIDEIYPEESIMMKYPNKWEFPRYMVIEVTKTQ